MATKKLPTLQEQLEAIKKRAGQPINSNPAVTAQKQVENYKTRIAATGKDPDDLTDKRNVVEKALKLPENQNAILDVLELLGRPSKALFSGANALVDNVQGGKRNVGAAMLEGLSGESKDSLKTVLQNITNSSLGDNENKWDWIDTLDLAGEVLLDPVDWALIPVTGGASLAADAAKVGSKVADAAKIAGVAEDVADVAGAGAKAIKMKSVSDILFQGAYKGIGKGVKGTDNLISKTLKSVSEDDYYRLYNGIKGDITRMMTQGGRMFKGVLRASDAAVDMAKKAILPKLARVDDLIKRTTAQYGEKMTEEVVSKNLYDLVELMDVDLRIPNKVSLSNLVKDMVARGKNGLGTSERTIVYNPETYRILQEAFESTGLGKVGDFIEIRKGTEGLDYINFTDNFFDKASMIGDVKASKELLKNIKNLDEIEVPVYRALTPKDMQRINRLKQDPIMLAAAKEYIGMQDEIYKVISSVSRIPVETLQKWSKNNDWRISHTVNDILSDEAKKQLAKLDKRMMDVFGGKYNVVKSRKWNMSALEANNLVRDQFIMAAAAGELKNIPEELETAARVFYGTDMFTRDVRSAFNFFGTQQTESIIRNDALQKVMLMAADESLGDPQLWRKKFGEGIPKGMTEVTRETGAKLSVRLKTMAEIYGDKKLAPKLMELAKDLESGDAVISKGLLQLLNRNTSREITNNIFEVLSRFNNLYKAGKTLSPMFNITNLGGNLFNMAMSGMKFTEIPKYYTAAHDLVKKIPDLMDRASRGLIQVGTDDEAMFKIVQEFINEGILGPSGELAPLGIAAKLKDMDTSAKYAGKENYDYIENMNKIHDQDGSFKSKYGFSVREIYDHMTQKISDAANPMEDAMGEAKKILKDREITLDKLNLDRDITKVPTQTKEVTQRIPARPKEFITFDGKEYNNADELIQDITARKDEMNYWEFKGKKFTKNRDGINDLISSLDNEDAKAEITRRITEYRKTGAKINPQVMDDIFNRVLVTDFKNVSNPLYTNEMIQNLRVSKSQSGDSLKGFSRNAKGKGKPKYGSREDQLEQIITETVEQPIDASKLVSPANIDYSNVYKGESVKVKPYSESQLKEIRAQKSWGPDKKAEFKKIRDMEEAEAIARYKELVMQKDPKASSMTQAAWVKENKSRTQSAAFLEENSLARMEEKRSKALDELIDKLEPDLADAILEGDGPKMNKAIAKSLDRDWNPIDQLITANMKGNSTVDSYSRLAMYLKAKDDPDFLLNLGVDNPMEAVRYALFDPADLSYTEENVLKKLIPFYTFTKKNLVYQMQNLAKHSSKYHRLYKGIRKTWENSGVGWENLPDYQMNQLMIPIPSVDADGNYNYIRVNLPFSDALEFAANPLQRTLSSFTPAVRAPFELATNRQIFTGQPISQYEGQMNKQIPFLDNKSAYALSQFGLDVPVRVASDMASGLGKMLEDIRGGSAPNPLDFTRGINLTREGNVYKNQSYETYEELQSVRDYMTKLKASGTLVPTIEELNTTNPLLDSIKAKLSKYK